MTGAMDLTTKLRAVRDGLLEGLVEREVAIRLALLAALAGEHLLLIGPPGTAKSELARRLRLAFADAALFERLLTRFTVPEELFGPLSIKALEEDRYERQTEGYLPAAQVAFLDEIFKANSAILNALLTLLNEREFDNGTRRVRTPLVAAIGASNELPEGEELDALYDRFLLRMHVVPVSDAAFPALLALRGRAEPVVPRLTVEDLRRVQMDAEAVEVPEDVVALLCELRTWCAAERIAVSDRRWRKVVKLLQVSALTNGRRAVSVWDCWLLQFCLWERPEQQAALYAWYAARVGASAAWDPAKLTRIVVAWEGKLQRDRDARSQARDAEGRPLYKGNDGKPTTDVQARGQARRGTEPLYLAPPDSADARGNWIHDRTGGGAGYTRDALKDLQLPHQGRRFREWSGQTAYLADESNWLMEDVDLPPSMEPTRQKPEYVERCLHDLDGLAENVRRYQAALAAHIASLDADIRAHLWVTPEFAGPAAASLQGTAKEVEGLLRRVAAAREGFTMLPREVEPPAPRPQVEVK